MRQLRNTYYIIINGQSNVGKDTFIKYCKQHIPCNNISTIDSLRFLANHVFYEDDKSKEYRNFLHQLKKLVKTYNPQYFKYYVHDRLEKNKLNFIHVREENEFNDYGKDCIKVLIVRNNLSDSELSDIDKSHNFNDIMYDHIIVNDGTLEQLKEKSKIFTDMFT